MMTQPAHSDIESTAERILLPGWMVASLRLFLTVSLPVFLVLTSVRLVASEVFLRLEYHRPGFPADRYGFTRADRLEYGPYAVRYMRNDADIGYLGDLTFENGEPLYTQEELEHMEDVKAVARVAFAIHLVLSLAVIASVIVLAWQPDTRPALRRGLRDGGMFTITLIITLVILIFANWDFFFDGFHNIFFESGTWQFSTADTLIRLYPEQFWFDAALTVGVLTVGGALGALLGGWYAERRARRLAGLSGSSNQNGAAEDPVRNI